MHILERDPHSITLQQHPLLQVLEGPLQKLLAPQHPVEHVVAHAAPHLLRVLLARHVELKTELGVQPDAKVVVHDGSLREQLAELGRQFAVRQFGRGVVEGGDGRAQSVHVGHEGLGDEAKGGVVVGSMRLNTQRNGHFAQTLYTFFEAVNWRDFFSIRPFFGFV